MKRLSLMSIMFFLLLSLAGCGKLGDRTGNAGVNPVDIYQDASHENEIMISKTIAELEFASVEELLGSYRAAKIGKVDEGLANLVENVNLAALEKLYLPTSIPKEYQLYKIYVNEEAVSFWYWHEENLASESSFLNTEGQMQEFLFSFTRRWGVDSPMDGILRQFGGTKEDLIDGKYYFLEPNLFIWASDRDLLHMYTPLTSPGYQRLEQDDNTTKLISPPDYAYELVKFVEVNVVNLLDDDAVTALIRQGQSTPQDTEQDVEILDDGEIE